ncbi:WYL domain-containing protein [Nocardioidaceae bacterium]|nr:WYL domain-containing protein [Nocardioidaceae bacterium]
MSGSASGSAGQLRRLLTLVPWVQAERELPLALAAERLGTTPKQLIKDLKVLWMCGLPGLFGGDLIEVDIPAAEEAGVLRVSNADYLARPLRLGATEAAALVVALRTLRDAVTPEVRELVDRTLVKLEAVAEDGSDLADRVEVTVGEEGTDPRTRAVRVALEDALARSRRVRLSYWTPSRDETTERDVDPLEILTGEGAEGRDYLDGWCHLAEGRRTFRLDRIVEVHVLDVAADPPRLAPLDVSEGIFQGSPDAALATLRLGREARWVAEYYPVVDAEEVAGGGLRVTLQASDPQWLVRLALRLAPHAEIESPAALADAVGAEARRALAAYT